MYWVRSTIYHSIQIVDSGWNHTLALLILFALGEFQTGLVKLLLFGVLAISLDLVWGFTGILSFAHGVFFTWDTPWLIT